MGVIYTRKIDRRNTENIAYSPPPGYQGNAFRGSTKVHEPTETVENWRSDSSENKVEVDAETKLDEYDKDYETYNITSKYNTELSDQSRNNDHVKALGQLISLLREKIGIEELILLILCLLIHYSLVAYKII